jgi:hypothetical protein
VALGIAAAILVLSSASALGPPSDIDSLNYHLGVPLEWIRHGGAVARAEWLSARLLGIGDMLSLLGLAMGTDTASAAVQAAGLVAAGAAMASVARSPRARALAWPLVAASPQVVTLTMTQKPQLLPAVAMVLAIVIVVDRRVPLTPSRIWLAAGTMMFAAASKYTFLLPAVVAVTALLAASRSGPTAGAIGSRAEPAPIRR